MTKPICLGSYWYPQSRQKGVSSSCAPTALCWVEGKAPFRSSIFMQQNFSLLNKNVGFWSPIWQLSCAWVAPLWLAGYRDIGLWPLGDKRPSKHGRPRASRNEDWGALLLIGFALWSRLPSCTEDAGRHSDSTHSLEWIQSIPSQVTTSGGMRDTIEHPYGHCAVPQVKQIST